MLPLFFPFLEFYSFLFFFFNAFVILPRKNHKSYFLRSFYHRKPLPFLLSILIFSQISSLFLSSSLNFLLAIIFFRDTISLILIKNDQIPGAIVSNNIYRLNDSRPIISKSVQTHGEK